MNPLSSFSLTAIIFELLYNNVFGELDKKDARRGQCATSRDEHAHLQDMFKNGDTNDDLAGRGEEQDDEGWTKVKSKSKGSVEC